MKYLLHFFMPAVMLAGCHNRTKNYRTYSELYATDTLVLNRPQVTAESMIIPGKSAGLTNIGENAARVNERLGRPDSGDAAMGKAISIWYAGHTEGDDLIAVYTERNMGIDDTSRVKMIRVTSPGFTTAEGIHTGRNIAGVRQQYNIMPQATYTAHGHRYTIFSAKGISFEVNADSVLTAIIVHEVTRPANSGYIPFHPNAKNLR
ncbi:hypothetical protein [uncultured Chitinophaga sp.]|uniref:hypothetical protein n=1 Tax=uncultured Chitinophaga sp. TaxID=339340 RepID=UPI0025D63D10|nr:hypothetical protein [uncultured Chitinophaga sp.]